MKRIAILALSVLLLTALLCACSAIGTMDPYYGGYSNVSTTRNGRVNGTNDGYYRGQYGYNGMYGQTGYANSYGRTGYANGYAQGGYAGSSYPNGYSQNGYTNGNAASGYTGSANSTTGMSTTTTTGRAATVR